MSIIICVLILLGKKMMYDFFLCLYVFEDSDFLREVKVLKFLVWKEYWLLGFVVMVWSFLLLILCLILMVNIVMLFFLVLLVLVVVSCLLLELLFVIMIVIFGMFGLWFKERNKWCYKIFFCLGMLLIIKCNCLKINKIL